MLLSGDTCRGCPTGPPQTYRVKTVVTPLSFPHPYSHRCFSVTYTDSFPSLIFTLPTYLRWVTGNVMAWATCGGPHATLYLYTIRRLTSPSNYVPSPLYALPFTLVRSCFHFCTCYSHTIPSIPRSCNNVLSI